MDHVEVDRAVDDGSHMVEPYSKIGLTIVMYKESRVEEEE